MTRHHQRRACKSRCAHTWGERNSAQRYRTQRCATRASERERERERTGDRDGHTDRRLATESTDPVYGRPRIHTDVSIHAGTCPYREREWERERVSGSERERESERRTAVACTYPPKHKPNTPVEAPSADECRRPFPLARNTPASPPLPQHPELKVLSLDSPFPRKPCVDARVRPLAPLSIPPFPRRVTRPPAPSVFWWWQTLPYRLRCRRRHRRRRGPGRVEANRRGRWNGRKEEPRRTVGWIERTRRTDRRRKRQEWYRGANERKRDGGRDQKGIPGVKERGLTRSRRTALGSESGTGHSRARHYGETETERGNGKRGRGMEGRGCDREREREREYRREKEKEKGRESGLWVKRGVRLAWLGWGDVGESRGTGERRGGGEESSGKGEVGEERGSPPRRQSPVCRERSWCEDVLWFRSGAWRSLSTGTSNGEERVCFHATRVPSSRVTDRRLSSPVESTILPARDDRRSLLSRHRVRPIFDSQKTRGVRDHATRTRGIRASLVQQGAPHFPSYLPLCVEACISLQFAGILFVSV